MAIKLEREESLIIHIFYFLILQKGSIDLDECEDEVHKQKVLWYLPIVWQPSFHYCKLDILGELEGFLNTRGFVSP